MRILLLGCVLPLWLAASDTKADFAVLARRAEEARLAGRPNDAIRLYADAVRIRPQWAEGWWRAGALLFDQDRFAEAEPALARYVALDPKPHIALALLGLSEYETRALRRAIAHFEKWQAGGAPGTPEIAAVARFHWALALTRTGRYKDATGMLTAQASAGDDSPHLIEAFGLAALGMPYLPEEAPAQDREMIYLMGRISWRMALGRFEETRADRKKLEARYGVRPELLRSSWPPARPLPEVPLRGFALAAGSDPAALYIQAQAAYRAGRYAEARDVLRRVVALAPRTAAGWAMLGLSEFGTHEYWRALTHLRRSLSLGLETPEDLLWNVRFHTAILLTRFERFDDGSDLLSFFGPPRRRSEDVVDAMGLAALRRPYLPSEMPAADREMVRLAGSGAWEVAAQHEPDAAKWYRELVSRYPDEPNAHYVYGAYLAKQNQAGAVAELKRTLELAPDHVPARVRLALDYLEHGEPDAALPYAREAMALSPKSFVTHLALGRALVEKDQLADGIRELEAARDLAPYLAHLRWSLATAYRRAGRNEDAERESAEFRKLEAKKR